MNEFVDFLGYWAVRSFAAFVRWLSVDSAMALGRFIGRLVPFFYGRWRIVYSDMKAAFGESFSQEFGREQIIEHYEHFGQMLIETLRFPKMDQAYIQKYIRIENENRFHEAIAQNKGVILLTGHFGNWELLQIVSGVLGKPIHVLARGHKHNRLNDYLNQLRESHGSSAIRRGMGIRDMLRGLRRKELIGLVADQDAGKHEGVILPFFGRKTTVPLGAFELASRTGAPILPCFIAREHGAHHVIHVGEPLKISAHVDADLEHEKSAFEFIKILESFIRKYPSQWLWETKRWKYNWTKRLLILSDGKPGHVKQSQAVVAQIQKNETQYGRRGLEFPVKTIQVEFRSEIARRVFPWAAYFLLPWIHGRVGRFRIFFTEESFKAIETASSDFVISAGSALVPLNVLIARESRAKSIVLMKPSFPFNFIKFDLALIPAHDEGVMPTRSFRTLLTPSIVDQNQLEEAAEKIRPILRNPNTAKVAVFLGGSTKHFEMKTQDIEIFSEKLAKLSPEVGDFTLTTSRRTPEAVVRFLKQRWMLDNACQMLVIASEDGRSEIVPGMMALADILVVTDDSVSMISEAVSAGKRVLVLSLATNSLSKKHRRFKEILSREAAITCADLGDFEEKMLKLANHSGSWKSKVHDEHLALRKRLQEIL